MLYKKSLETRAELIKKGWKRKNYKKRKTHQKQGLLFNDQDIPDNTDCTGHSSEYSLFEQR